jgi:hypothetical protein
MIMAITNPATTIASGLADPSSLLSSEGTPKMPLPMMPLTINPTIAHRPMDRSNFIARSNFIDFPFPESVGENSTGFVWVLNASRLGLRLDFAFRSA